MPRLRALFVPLTLVLASMSAGQGDGFVAAYARYQGLAGRFAGKASFLDVKPNWFDAARFWFRVDLAGGRKEYWLVDGKAPRKAPLFSHAKLAEALGALTRAKLDPSRLDVRPRSLEGSTLRLLHGGRAYQVDLGSYRVQPVERQTGETDGVRALRFPAVSGDSDERVEMTFVNDSPRPVRLWWVTGEGRRVEYGRVEPKTPRTLGTYASHVWLLTPVDSDRELAYYRTPDAPDRFVFTGQEPEPQRPQRRRDGVPSPDGKWTALVRDGDLWVRQGDGEPWRLSADAKPGDAYAEGGISWSPDSTKLVAFRVARGDTRELTLIESAPRDQLQPRVTRMPYLKPGDKIDHPKPVLFELGTKRAIELDATLMPNPWSIDAARWGRDGKSFTMLYNQRGHQVVRLLRVDATTGKVETLAEETSNTFVDYPNKIWYRFAGNDLLWMSQRSGWNHLYRLDAATGLVRNAITQGEWVVRGVEWVDDANRRLCLRVMGAIAGQDPYHVHYATVGFDGSGFRLLTSGDGTHQVAWSADRSMFVATHSRVDLPPVHELRRTSDGAKLLDLGQADVSALLSAGYVMPERFVAKGRDDKTDVWGVIWRPTGFDPARRYPVVESIYAGPHGFHVPKSFQTFFGQQAMAELGFVLVQVDGMGTNWRSKAFHDVAWKNLADAGFPDRVRWIRAMGAKYGWADLDRVGIYGGSAGGQNAMRALLDHADLYKVAVADCGCHDNRMDKIWWNELWMGWPVDESYARSSNREHAGKLRGDLMLVVGEIDSNVDPASTLQVADALIRAGKPFEMVIVPGAGHGATGTPYGARKQAEFLYRRLSGSGG